MSGLKWKEATGGQQQQRNPADRDDFVERCKRIPALGLLLAIAGGVAFALTLVLVKISGVFPLVVLFERSVLQLLVFLSGVILAGRSCLGITSKRLLLLSLLSATFGALFPVLCHLSLFFIPVADTVAIFFASPAFITLYSCVTTRRNPGLYKMVVLGLALSGVVFVTKPVLIFGTDEETSSISWLEGCLLAIGSSVSYAGFCLSCNRCKEVPVESLNLLVSACNLGLIVPVVLGLGRFRLPSCGLESAYAMASAATGTLAVLFLILATKLEKAGPVAIGNAVELPSIIVFQILMTGENPTWNCYLGSALIVTSVLISGWLRWQEDRNLEYSVVQCQKAPRLSLDLSLLEESAV